MTIEMRQKRAKLAEQSKAILMLAKAENRDLTADEIAKFDKLHADINGMKEQIDRIERQETLELELRAKLPMIAGGMQGSTKTTEDQESFTEFARKSGAFDAQAVPAAQFLRAAVLGPKTEAERRALSGATDSAGGFTIQLTLAAEIIDMLRAQSVCGRAGARFIPLTGPTAFAQVATDAVAAWRAENAPIPESAPSFTRILFTPRVLAVLVRASRELLEDSVNVEDALMRSLAASMAVEVDRVALRGSGTGAEPRGIANTVNVHSHSMGVNGAALANLDPLLEARNLILAANGNEPSAYIMAPRTATAIARLKDTTGQPIAKPAPLAQPLARFLSTTSIPINETQGTATAIASRIICGDFKDLWIGVRTEMRIEILRERYADTLQYGFLAYLRADVGVVRPRNFAQVVGIL